MSSLSKDFKVEYLWRVFSLVVDNIWSWWLKKARHNCYMKQMSEICFLLKTICVAVGLLGEDGVRGWVGGSADLRNYAIHWKVKNRQVNF